MITQQNVREALISLQDPGLEKNIIELQMVRDVLIEQDNVCIVLALITLGRPMKKKIVNDVEEAVKSVPGVSSVDVELTVMKKEELDRLFEKHPLKGIDKVRRFIAIGSGKGGVGKTTVAINLALALSKQGFKVGLLDADVYGPSIPTMLGLSERPRAESGMMLPLGKYGLKIMSFGFFIDEGQPLIWRGPLAAKTLRQLLDDVMWGELDYLVVDLPPGTGDPSITIAKAIPSVSVIVVTTPQEVALADVRKAIGMFREMNIKIAGIVENMAYFMCGHTSEKIEIFGAGGGEALSRQTDIPLLGSIPIDIELRKGGDSGVPLMFDSPQSETGEMLRSIIQNLIGRAKTTGTAALQA